MNRLYRRVAAAVAVTGIAACGGSGTTAPSQLTRDQVAGVYAVCEMTFRPIGLTAVDLLAAATEPSPAPPLPPPNLKVGRQTAEFELEYTPRGDVLPRRFTGAYTLRSSTVTLDFSANAATLASALLLPPSLPLVYDPAFGRLSITSSPYTVDRRDYGRLAGLTEEQMRNLQDRIEGTLTGRFALGSCS